MLILTHETTIVYRHVYGGYFDEEFEAFTKPLFDRILSDEFVILFLTSVQAELENAPKNVKELIKILKKGDTEFLEETDEVVELASLYIAEKVIGQASFSDCLHIAFATIHHADYLVSWNFKHIVNVQRIRGYNSINIRQGYKQLEIRSPRELINYEN